MPTTCELDFENNPMKVMYAGQLLRGTVRLHLTEEKNVRGIYIRINGTAYAHWSEGSGKTRKTYTGNEDYLDEKTYFVGGTDGTVSRDVFFFCCSSVPDVEHVFSFQCLQLI